MQRFRIVLAFLLGLTCFCEGAAFAQLTPAHRKELAQLTKDVGQAAAAIRKKDYDAAGTQLSGVEEKLKEIVTTSGVAETDPAIKRLQAAIDRQRETLSKATGETVPKAGKPADSGEISFVKEIAPIINARCISCHGENNPRRGLRLDTFAGWRTGGMGGLLLTPGNPNTSLILARINAPQGQGRMPANGNPLIDEEKEKISSWIKTGAKFDGINPSMSLTQLMFEDAKKDVKIPKPTGTETVKFTRDIAPFMANLCLNCHNSQRKSGGLSVETFFDIMKGGESGEVIIPGDAENSRLFRLVGGLENPRMPANQSRITRKNYEDLKLWFKEGNTFDGNDPLTQIATFVPSEAEMARSEFGSKSDAEMAALRQKKTADQYRDATGEGIRNSVESPEFLIVGDVDQSRLLQVQTWAKSHLAEIQKKFGGAGVPWRGRLAIFVWKDRATFEEFTSRVQSRRAPKEVYSTSQVTLGHGDAYLALEDTGDNPGKGPSLEELLVQRLTMAYLQRGEKAIPEWLALGLGYQQSKEVAGPERVRGWETEAAALAPAVSRPEELFIDGTFSPASVGPVGFAIVKYMQAKAGEEPFKQFLRAVERGETVNEALKKTYGVEGSAIAVDYFKSLKSR